MLQNGTEFGKNTHCLFMFLIHNIENVASAEERKYPADIRVKFPDTTAMLASNITLECFALGK